MDPIMYIILLGVLLVVIFAVKGFAIVRQAETMIIERLGKYNRTLESGINIIWPIVDKPRAIDWRYVSTDASSEQRIVITKTTTKIDLRETVYDFPRQNVITRDNVSIEIDALVYFQITHPAKAVYEVANLPDAIEKLTQTTLRNVIGELDLDESLVSRDTINKKLKLILDEATDKWGVKVNRVIEDRTPSAFQKIYDPSHPVADSTGVVLRPNISVVQEMVDMIDSSRAYEANVTALNSTKQILAKSLEIGG